jgi:transposase InsO family protein
MSESLATVGGMSWKATDPMKERTKFVLEWERRWKEAEGGWVNMAELCRVFGVSRQTGYKWVGRYREADYDVSAVVERSRRPKTSPHALSVELQDLIVDARKRWPRWGPRKLHQRLMEANPGKAIPSASVIAKVLLQRGITTPRRGRRRARSLPGVVTPFAGCEAANAVWCIDFKGWFLTGDGRRCYPLTLLDAYSRYLLRCEALVEPNGKRVQEVLDSAFLEFGLPIAIRSDGGPPFASRGPALLTDLSVWLLKLGIRIEIIAPGKPQQNGRLERLHRTLQADVASPPASDRRAQQRRFDPWRHEYNFERPHEALDQRRPGSVYTTSRRTYPRPLIDTPYDPFGRVAKVDKGGSIKWHRRNLFISSALRHELLQVTPAVVPETDGRWEVRWGSILIGILDDHHRDRGLIVPRRPRGTVAMQLLAAEE